MQFSIYTDHTCRDARQSLGPAISARLQISLRTSPGKGIRYALDELAELEMHVSHIFEESILDADGFEHARFIKLACMPLDATILKAALTRTLRHL